MCETCGCSIGNNTEHNHHKSAEVHRTEHLAVSVMGKLLSANDEVAAHNREHLDQKHVLAINLMSSPGAGKTALLEATIDALSNEFQIAVIEGDLETENDAERIRAKGVPAIQICTGSACHLDAHLIHDALHELDLNELDILFIENVGNLVCPAAFDLGQHRNVVMLSVPEGDDKPAKYPVMFRAADLVLISKIDLLEVLDDFDLYVATQHLRNLSNTAEIIPVSARNTDTLTRWVNWLRRERSLQQQRREFVVSRQLAAPPPTP